MKLLKVSYLIITILIGASCTICKSYPKVTCKGKALNAKAGAIVYISRDSIYYIDGMEEWGDDYYGETIKIKGCLDSVFFEKKSTDSIKIAEILCKPTIYNAKVRVKRFSYSDDID